MTLRELTHKLQALCHEGYSMQEAKFDYDCTKDNQIERIFENNGRVYLANHKGELEENDVRF